MAQVKESEGNLIAISSLFRRKTSVVKEQPMIRLKMEKIFISKQSAAFTEFGERLYGTLIAQSMLSELKIGSERRTEILGDIRQRCEELKINENQLSQIRVQMDALIGKKDSEINNYGKSLFKRGLEKFLKL